MGVGVQGIGVVEVTAIGGGYPTGMGDGEQQQKRYPSRQW